MEMHFEDSSKHEKILEQHMSLARFIKRLGCDHLKINTGPRRPAGRTAQDLKNMAAVLDMLGHRMADETGLKFGVHAHMWTQLENRHEIDAIMASTDPKHVGFVLDTWHITMAGNYPVGLAPTPRPPLLELHP